MEKKAISKNSRVKLMKQIVESVEKSHEKTKKVTKKEKLPKDWGVINMETGPIASVEYVTREPFDAQIVDMSNEMGKQANMIYRNNETIMSRTQYQGWLVSPVLWKRSLAVYGHALLVHMAVVGVAVLIVLLIGA